MRYSICTSEKASGPARLPMILITGLLVFPTLAAAQPATIPDCSARLTLAREGIDQLSGVEKFLATRGTVSLDKDRTANLSLTLDNLGKTEKFNVVVEPVGGVLVTTGGGSRKVTVKTGESGTMPLTVKGTDVGESCDWRSRGLRVTARPQGVSTRKACATLEMRFFCPPQNKSAPGRDQR